MSFQKSPPDKNGPQTIGPGGSINPPLPPSKQGRGGRSALVGIVRGFLGFVVAVVAEQVLHGQSLADSLESKSLEILAQVGRELGPDRKNRMRSAFAYQAFQAH